MEYRRLRKSCRSPWTTALLSLSLLSASHAVEAVSADEINDFFQAVCTSPNPPPPEWDLGTLVELCFTLVPGGPAGGGPTGVATQLSSTGQGSAGTGTAGSQAKAARKKLDKDSQQASGQSASADYQFGSLGLTLALQKGETDRSNTVRESGYDSDLRSGMLAVDYQFSDALIAGVGVARSEVNADLDFSAGSFDVDSTSWNLFATYLPAETLYVSAYLGRSDLDYDNRRNVLFGGSMSQITGKTDGSQVVAGLSVGTDWYRAEWTLSPFFSLDYVKTRLDGYTEQGNSLLEFDYASQRSESLLSGLGLRVSRLADFNWGVLIPEARLTYQHEFQDDSRAIRSQLVNFPGQDFITRTDNPDRNYFLWGLGLVLETSDSVQLFVDYEANSGHSLLDTWAASAGVVVTF